MTITFEEIQQLPDTYDVGDIRVNPNIILAPMAGVTDTVFRRIILGLGGCGLVSTEMTNAASVSPKALKRHHLLDFYPEERPLTMQLSGNEPDLVAAAAANVEQLGADIIDINCGCPSPKVTGGGHGSALLKDLPKLGQLLRAVRAAVSVPVTLKFRAGWDEARLNYVETAKIAEDAGINALALHPRTKEQAYKGSADWRRVAAVKAAVGIPVIGSGDVTDAADALARLRDSGADGVMIGRGAMENPWIFLQIAQLRRGEPVFEPTPADKLAFLNQYFDMCLAEMPERLALNKLKQLIGQFSVGLPGSATMRAGVHRSNGAAYARTELELFFAPYMATSLAM
ncbi:tRNA dihydrouridine synthase DusB [Oscillochloris sp. ZM17-4]|uniref:tRNA dihydrouridine synthase DusB n=1 Tax=Oscillochloris sp. ZM17-4 TaxID=2866714 RepID=UPI001C72DC5E|nr:tRNA dihydrouridine synthase DusB [Oscillochloris sp. ZM17-4]MBX0328884.1 tRNA dihydrouridine synthase DusB [Oscillochloris sp. ZM17-4]